VKRRTPPRPALRGRDERSSLLEAGVRAASAKMVNVGFAESPLRAFTRPRQAGEGTARPELPVPHRPLPSSSCDERGSIARETSIFPAKAPCRENDAMNLHE
jgi:hypothetical protein